MESLRCFLLDLVREVSIREEEAAQLARLSLEAGDAPAYESESFEVSRWTRLRILLAECEHSVTHLQTEEE